MGLLKKFGSHYAIERFGVMFLSLTLCMIALISSILFKKVAYDNRALSGNAIYTRSFSMSQSGTTGQVTGIYTNKDHTRVLLMLSFDNMDLIPTDANDYSLILSGATRSGAYDEIKSNPSAMIYTFGGSGTMGVYLQDVNGFPSQLLQMYIRSNVNVTGSSSTDTSSFNRYDQALVYFNPGGAYATQVDFLEKEDWSLFDMVEEVMTRSNERVLRLTLRDDLLNMAKQQILIDMYRDRLDKLNVQVPDNPLQISDTVYAMAVDGSSDERLHYITSYGGGWVTPDESTGYQNDQVIFYLDSKYVVSGGFDFNWQDGRILTGYLQSLTGSTSLTDWTSYMTDRRNSVAEGEDFATTVSRIEWKFKDGSLVNTDQSSFVSQQDKQVFDTINSLKEAWNSYYNLKVQYEKTDLPNLLQLEIDARSAVESYSLNVGDNGRVLTIV